MEIPKTLSTKVIACLHQILVTPSAPSGAPEKVNHNKPPSYWVKEIFKLGDCKRDYSKIIDGKAILKNQDLMVAIQACPELKAFVNRIIALCDGEVIS